MNGELTTTSNDRLSLVVRLLNEYTYDEMNHYTAEQTTMNRRIITDSSILSNHKLSQILSMYPNAWISFKDKYDDEDSIVVID